MTSIGVGLGDTIVLVTDGGGTWHVRDGSLLLPHSDTFISSVNAIAATAVNGQTLGVGQTWQNMLGSRAAGTTYTNSTGRPIFVSIVAGVPSSSATLAINGIVVGTTSTGTTSQVGGIVPAGGTYVLQSNASVLPYWAELR